ncbi:MAG: histidine kinase, partial [Bacteroidota bacterium]
NPRKGLHEIQFRASSSDGVYNKNETLIRLKFLEVWYNSNWFKMGVGILLVGGVLAWVIWYNRQKRNQLQKRYKLTEEINQLKLRALNGQMNPHFVFNAMSSIQQMIGAQDNKLAMTYLSKFSRLLRHVINYSADSWVALDEELKFIEHYLQLEQARFDDLFDYSIRVDHNLQDNFIKIPTFFIQPQVENAIKHGLRNSKRKGLITIEISSKGPDITIKIEDNGIGREQSRHINSMSNDFTNKGIELTQKRVNQLKNQGYKASFTIEDLKAKNGDALGTRVVLTFTTEKPIINA